MVKIELTEDKLILNAQWNEKYFIKPLEFSLENIAGAEINCSLARGWLKRMELLKQFVPGVTRQGAYYEDGNCVYWEVRDPNRTIAISLQNEPYEKLIVEVEDPHFAVRIIEEALKNKEIPIDDFIEQVEMEK